MMGAETDISMALVRTSEIGDSLVATSNKTHPARIKKLARE